MSQLIIRKNNRSKYDDDYDHSRYITPKRYRTPERTIYTNNYHDENGNYLLDRKYPVIIGDFTLIKPEDKQSFYNYKPKNTDTSYIYRGTARSSEVLERAKHEVQQYVQGSSILQKKIPFMNQHKHYQSMLTLPNSHFRSSTDDDYLIGDYSRDSLYETSPPPPPRRNHSCSSLYTARSAIVSIEQHQPYYFGEPEESDEEKDDDDDDEEERCIIFGSKSQPKPLIRNTIFLPSRLHNNEQFNDAVIFQEVIDIGTSTDDLVYNTVNDRRDIYPNPSFRSETGVYRVSRHDAEQNNYEEPDVALFPAAKHHSQISTSSSSSAPSDPIPSKNNIPIGSPSKINSNAKQENLHISDHSDDNENEEKNLSPLPTPTAPESVPKLQRLSLENSMGPIPAPRNEYVPMIRESEASLNSKSTKSGRSRRRPKPPPTVLTQKSEGFPGPSSILPLRRLSSTPVTDLDEELINGEINFRLSRGGIRGTPRPRARTPRPDEGDDEDDDQTQRPIHSARRPPKHESSQVKLIHEGTQSEEKSTRNVGTMHESIQTRNFGNEVQPQSSSTQTPASKKASFVYLERPEPPQTLFDEPKISPRTTHDYYDRYSSTVRDRFDRRSPSPPVDDYRHYDDDDLYPRMDIRHRHHTSSPPTVYPCFSKLPPDHLRIPMYRSPTPSPPRPSRYSSPDRRSHSATPRHRRRMHSQETDTSLDAMKSQQHAGVQYEPRSTREKGTSISIRLKRPTTPIHRPLDRFEYPQQTNSSPYPSLRRWDARSEKNYYNRPPVNDYRKEEAEDEEEEEETPSMHDQSTMADLIVNLDHFTQCEPQPYMADHYVQTTPTLDEYEQRNIPDIPEDKSLRQLAGRHSVSIPQPVIIQPPTLPRRIHRSPTRPIRDGLDYTGKILEVSLYHGQQQRTDSIRHPPPLNIGTEHVINQSPTNEFTIPFETRYVYDSVSSSSIQSRKKNSIMPPRSNSPRTHLYTNDHSIHQSRSNGNFYLSSPPPRPFNSSFRLNITTNKS